MLVHIYSMMTMIYMNIIHANLVVLLKSSAARVPRESKRTHAFELARAPEEFHDDYMITMMTMTGMS